MAAHSGIVFVACLFCLYSLTDSRILSLVDDEKNVPPLCSRTCHPSSDFRGNTLFQHKCSCSQSCAAYGDCCYDSPYKGRTSQQFAFTCFSVHDVEDFQAVSSCPPNYRSDACSEYLGYLPPVTSKTTNITYGNVFCASCNGDGNNLISWKVELRCAWRNDLLDFGVDYTQIKYSRGKFWGRSALDRTWRECKFYVTDLNHKFFGDLELRPCKKPTMKSTCSRTWRDDSVEQKCRSYEDPVYIEDLPYRNRHCAQCNYERLVHAACAPSSVLKMLSDGLLDEGTLRSCRSRSSPYACMSLYSGRGDAYGLRYLFQEQRVAKIRERGCPSPGERYDDNTGKCKRVVRG